MKRSTYPLALALILAILEPGYAQPQESQCGVARNVKPVPLDELTWRRLNRTYELAGEENYTAAHDDLVRMQERARGDYLRAVISRTLAQVQWAREEYDAALESFELAVALDALPDETHFWLMYQIAQLYHMKERYPEALEKLNMWFCNAPPGEIRAGAWVLKASIHAQMSNWPEVVVAIDSAIGMVEPRENWFQLRLTANLKLDDMTEAARTLDSMISHWPEKKAYWMRLSNVHFSLGDHDEALSVAALAYRKNLLDEQSEYLYLSSLFASRNVPYKAAGVLQDGIEKAIVEPGEKHWTMVADAWYAAAELEKALAAYEIAGKAALDGDTDLRRGYILIDLERWEEAREALARAIDKGGIGAGKLGEAHLMAGMSEFSLGNYSSAGEAWERAATFEQSKDAARQWMNHLREEQARQALRRDVANAQGSES